jgi:hypothetical protein
MSEGIMLTILNTAANGSYSTRELIRTAGYSPSTVIKYLDEMEKRDLIERVRAKRMGPGGPPILINATRRGLAWTNGELSSLLQKLYKDHGAVWGPSRTFSFWGITFYGAPDIFSKSKLESSPFEQVLEPDPEFYDNLTISTDGPFPSIESLIAWVSKTKNPRYLAASALLLGHPDLDFDRLRKLATHFESLNRIGFLASLSSVRNIAVKISPQPKQETMLPSYLPVNRETAVLARHWHIINPLSKSVVEEMSQLYGSSLQTNK